MSFTDGADLPLHEGLSQDEILGIQRTIAAVHKFLNLLRIPAGDSLGMVLRSHFLLEQALTQTISDHFVRPDAIDWDAVGSPDFMTRVRFAYALGIIDEQVKGYSTKLGHLRNQFAHTIDKELEEADVMKLRKAFPDKEEAIKDMPPSMVIAQTVAQACITILMHKVQPAGSSPRRLHEMTALINPLIEKLGTLHKIAEMISDDAPDR